MRLLAEFAGFGLGPRHLRAAGTAADREADLIARVLAPLSHHRNPRTRERAEAAEEHAAMLVRLHALLLRKALREQPRSSG